MRATRRFWGSLAVSVVLLVAFLLGVAWLWTRSPSVDTALWLLLLMSVVSLWALGMLLYLLVAAFRLRRKVRGQLADAVARNPGAFLAAVQSTVAQPLPSLADAPMTVLWRSTPGNRWFFGVFAGMALVDLVAQLGTAPGILPGVPPFSILLHTLSGLTLFFRLGIALGAVLVIALVVQTVLARPVGVVLSDVGIEMRRQFGRRRMLRWAEARHLEYHVSQGRYELRGEHRSVFWPRFPPKRARPLSISSEEAATRLKITLALVAERTGLRPRAVM